MFSLINSTNDNNNTKYRRMMRFFFGKKSDVLNIILIFKFFEQKFTVIVLLEKLKDGKNKIELLK